MIPIEETKRIDWNAIRAEYIGGCISQRKLAKKYGIAEGTLLQRANTEQWQKLRNQATIKSITRTEQKLADAAADNATTAARIKAKLLKRLEREIDALPDSIGTEMYQDITTMSYQAGENGVGTATKRTDGGKKYKLRDLTAAYKDLTEDMDLNVNNDSVRIIIDV